MQKKRTQGDPIDKTFEIFQKFWRKIEKKLKIFLNQLICCKCYQNQKHKLKFPKKNLKNCHKNVWVA